MMHHMGRAIQLSTGSGTMHRLVGFVFLVLVERPKRELFASQRECSGNIFPESGRKQEKTRGGK